MNGLFPAMSQDLSFLSGTELFCGLERSCINTICARGRIEHVAKEKLIFEQGRRAGRAYVLVVGNIRIVQTGYDGGQSIIRFIAPGELFGTVPLFTDHQLPGDAVTGAPSRILSWSEEAFLGIIGQCPAIARNVIQIIGARLAEAQNRIRELATQRSDQRIAHALLRLAGKVGHTAHGGEMINIPVRRRDIVEVSGTTLYTASRTLSAWKKAGLLTAHNRHIIILNLPMLRGIAQGADGCSFGVPRGKKIPKHEVGNPGLSLRKRKGAAASGV